MRIPLTGEGAEAPKNLQRYIKERHVIQRLNTMGEWEDVIEADAGAIDPKTLAEIDFAEAIADNFNDEHIARVDVVNAVYAGMRFKMQQEVPAPRSILRLTPEERKEIMAKNPPLIAGIHSANAYFDWQWQGCGFGQLAFSYDRETDEITCSDERMGKERVRTLLYALADHIADNATFD
jgi:hypothetical protein